MPDGPDNVDDLSQDLSAISADDCKVSSDQLSNEAFYLLLRVYVLTYDCKASLSFEARARAKSGANSGTTTPPIAGPPLAPPLAAAQASI